jgi:N-acetylneuraminate synthase
LRLPAVSQARGGEVHEIELGGVLVGDGHPPYVIAEIGSNHNGDMDLCRRLIDAAADAGAHAVKFQSWSEQSLIAREEYDRNLDYDDKKKHFGSLREMVRAYQFTPDQHVQALAWCRERGIAFCSSAFSPEEVNLLDELDVPFFKVASMDVTYLPLLRFVAGKKRPVVLATGMATLGEVERAVDAIRSAGNEQLVLLHCVSIYPPEYDSIRLLNIPMLRDAFDVPVGFSDHTLGTSIPLAAVALGACIIEKHFTIDPDMEGWDHAISADPGELRTIVEEGAHVWAALGGGRRVVTAAEVEKRARFRRSLVVRRDLPVGHALREDDLTAKRPGTGVSPADLDHVVGRSLRTDKRADDVVRWEDLTS